MQTIAQTMGKALEGIKQTALKPQQTEQPKQVVLHQSQEAKQELTTILFQCFQALKLYGKEPEAFEAVTAMHLLALSDYPMERIRHAFGVYIRHYNELPTPADIVNIIERNGKPPYDKAVYVRLSQKRKEYPESMTSEEWRYMDDYERWIVSGRY